MAGVRERVEDLVEPSQVSAAGTTEDGQIVVVNPATGQEIGRVPELSGEAVGGIARRARAAPGSCCALSDGSSTTATVSSGRSSPRRARPTTTR